MSTVANLPLLLRTLHLPTIGMMWQDLLAQAEDEQWGHALITQGVRVRYFSSVALIQMLQQARNELRLTDVLHKATDAMIKGKTA